MGTPFASSSTPFTNEETIMGGRKGMRHREPSRAGASSRESHRDPDTRRHSIEEPSEDDSRKSLASSRSDESDDDNDERIDEENDLA